MGAHDQTLDKDAHTSIRDDGRTLRRIQEDEWEVLRRNKRNASPCSPL